MNFSNIYKNILALRKCEEIGNETILKLISSDRVDFNEKLSFEKIKKYLRPLQKENFQESFNNNFEKVEEIFEFCEKQNINYISVLDSDYPALLSQIPDRPALFFYKGLLDNSKLQKSIAIVGTRKYSDYGKSQAKKYARALVQEDFAIVSGLAYGIDAISHQEAVSIDGYCVAVLGNGINKVYPPANFHLAEKILEKNGAIISEFEPFIDSKPEYFPMRNRIIAGLSQATMVIEADIKSGSLITARMAFENNRAVYALPADVTRSNSQGCNLLIKENIAKLSFTPEDIISDISGNIITFPKEEIDNLKNYQGINRIVLENLKLNPMDVDELSHASQRSVSELNTILTDLELEGVIIKTSDGKFRVDF